VSVADYFLRDDLRRGAMAHAIDAATLLQWADEAARRAAPETVYREKEGRKTLRLQLQGDSFFLKDHRGVGWPEIAKNLLQLRLPVLGAGREYRAVRLLETIGVDTLAVAAYASQGSNPATLHSMLLTDDLVGTISLEDYCADWRTNPPPFAVRMRLTLALADIARRMHGAGINHRDFYLCHFHLDEQSLQRATLRCHVIDLHRARIRREIPRRWRVKDLAGLYFSAMDCGLTRRDLLRFMRHYEPGGLRVALGKRAGLWRQVARRARALYVKGHGGSPPAVAGPGHGH
jgi:heptose I phosphotransferase